ncbi:MAG: sulfide/dihydroorotate dehydrogenase-like FAD/NAD-binding protein [Planctomycetota bacterium]
MFRIIGKRVVAEKTKEIVVEAPEIASHAAGGQFVILRNNEQGERYPLTIADYDAAAGTITLVFLEIGKSTSRLGRFEAGDSIADVVGPLGNPTDVGDAGTVICIGGGVGIAAAHPVAKAFREAGGHVIGIIGAKNDRLLFFEDEMRAACNELIVTTDDGSVGAKGFVTERLAEVVERLGAENIGEVFAVGPTIMMKAVAEATRPLGIKTTVSLNPIMVDGTGMCGGCRVEVGGETKFACVDGPDFDAHLVDFDLLMARQKTYHRHEAQACKLEEEADGGS